MKIIIVIGLLLVSSHCFASNLFEQEKETIYINHSGVLVPTEINSRGTTYIKSSDKNILINNQQRFISIQDSDGNSEMIYKQR